MTMAESEKKAGISVGDLKGLISEVVKSMSPTTDETTEKKTEPTTTNKNSPSRESATGDKSVAEQVREALSGIKKEEEKEAREKRIDEQLAALSVANQEKTPVERNRLHKLMGWGENE
jgi:Sec-independent protein translocase protein TatA